MYVWGSECEMWKWIPLVMGFIRDLRPKRRSSEPARKSISCGAYLAAGSTPARQSVDSFAAEINDSDANLPPRSLTWDTTLPPKSPSPKLLCLCSASVLHCASSKCFKSIDATALGQIDELMEPCALGASLLLPTQSFSLPIWPRARAQMASSLNGVDLLLIKIVIGGHKPQQNLYQTEQPAGNANRYPKLDSISPKTLVFWPTDHHLPNPFQYFQSGQSFDLC